MAKKFKQYIANMGIIVKNALVKTHHSIHMIGYYHGPWRQVYSNISTKIPNIEPNLALQMSFKTINNLVGFNGLVFTLLVFDIYPRMIKLDVPSLSIIQHMIVVKKAIDKVRKYTVS